MKIKRNSYPRIGYPRRRISVLAVVLAVLLAASLLCNGWQLLTGVTDVLYMDNANSRDTYYSIHHVAQAHEISRGAGVKVGVIDASFALDDYPGWYAGGEDFSGNRKAQEKERGHGWMMTAALREIAPDCEIYALSLSHDNEEKRVDSIIAAIEWAVENGLQVLTLSQAQVSEAQRPRLDAAVDKAVEQGIVTCFIHYDNPNNLLPYSTTPYLGDYGREPDINVFHYDYNATRVNQMKGYMNRTSPPESGDDVPYFSFSSMSPVTAGFVAILKSIDPGLTPAECKQLLIDTSYPLNYTGVMEWENGLSEHTVDIERAAAAARERAK